MTPAWMAVSLTLACVVVGVGGVPFSPPAVVACRCTNTSDACWPSEAEWNQLNASVGGHLIPVLDELNACLGGGGVATGQCEADLARTDDEFFYTGQPGGYMHTGLAAGAGQDPWSIAHKLSAFAVAAQTGADVAAGVAFAAKHNLRLAVKGTGHDWFGRSGSHPDLEGSLLIWTHNMKAVKWGDGAGSSAFVAEGCSASSGVQHAVTLEAGNQFADFYPEAEKRGRLINGGTCTSVGVGGCTLGGCFGPFSQLLGPSASNVLQAKVVLANGTLVTASKCSHPELFWALRGGGAGHAVVTEWTMRSYPSPRWISRASFGGEVKSAKESDIMAVAVEVLRAADVVMAAHQGWNGDVLLPTMKSSRFGISLSTYEGNASIAQPLFAAFKNWIKAQPKSMQVSGSFKTSVEHKPTGPNGWIKPGAPEGQVSLPWDDPHHDTGLSNLSFATIRLIDTNVSTLMYRH